MGATGVGKSYFMQTLLSALGSTRNAKVNQTLATQRDFKIEPIVIHPIERYMTIARLYPHLESLGTRIIVVETPGLDPGETAKGYTDLDKLKGLASWFLKNGQFPKGTFSQANVGGIIYLHDISLDRGSKEVPKRYFNLMNQLLGFDIPLASVMLVTTKWKNVEPDDGEKRESELNREHWNTLTTPAGEQGGRDVNFGDRRETIRDPDFTRQLTLQLKKSTRISRLLLGMEEGGTNWEVQSDPAQHLKESVEDLSRLMSQLTTRDAMRLFALEVSSTFKMIYNRMYL
ncbi:hypothetical protein FA13DRAFT_1816886 [Coprinellus micaceus]|uniref:G domain-containing protein n=1 Tax=Coprinellus micaceus TaxID=71717 RepID=A0A4Y7SX51_COPMI|nr:hypothetical protein FA13DRAFT_1816886 [Coprinellus micaceus]